MSHECHPEGRCPQCGYVNTAEAQRCLRCRAIIRMPKGCNGACSSCLTPPPAPPAKSS